MKKSFFSLIFLITLCITSHSQTKVIEDPVFGGTEAPYVQITKLELRDTCTVLDFKVDYHPGWWIQVNSDKTHIKNSEGGKSLYVVKADEITLNKKHWMDDSGSHRYTLYFPPVEEGTEKIDFLEEQWKIYDIDLSGNGNSTTFLPQILVGNWFHTNGSNEWAYGFDKDKLIMKGQVFTIEEVKTKKRKGEIIYSDAGEMKSLFYKKAKNGQLKIGKSRKNLKTFGKEKIQVAGSNLKKNEFFETPIMEKDSAIYKGYIKGYHPKMGKTGLLHINNILTGDQESYTIHVQGDGTFYCKFPMFYPHIGFVRISNIAEAVYFEPGETTFQWIDLDYALRPRWVKDTLTNNSQFMGKTAKVNADLNAMDNIGKINHEENDKKLLELDANGYKTYVLEFMDRETEKLNQYKNANSISRKAAFIKEKDITFRAYQRLVSFPKRRESTYRRKHKVPRDQREIPLEQTDLTGEFYSFLDQTDLNSPLNLVSTDYDYFVNYLKFSDIIKEKTPNPLSNLQAAFKKENIPLTKEQKSIIKNISQAKSMKAMNEILNENGKIMKPLFGENRKLIQSVALNSHSSSKFSNLEKKLGISPGLMTDIMTSQDHYQILKSKYEPFDTAKKEEIKNLISTTFIADYLIGKSDELKQEIAAIKKMSQSDSTFQVHQTPKTEADKLFEAMMEPFKGKVVYVDFWATWCGPCIAGMKQIAPLKEELNDKDVVFVYITNQSSPEKTWEIRMPKIKGEHYRLTKDEWNILSEKFQIGGIPHYVLVDKNGKVARNDFRLSNGQLKSLFDEYLN